MHEFSVEINRNVELLGFVYFLGYEGAEAGKDAYPEKMRQRYAYGLDLYRRYKSFAGNRNLAVVIGYAQDIWLDYFINLLVQLDNVPDAKLPEGLDTRYYIRFSPSGDAAEARKHATAFLDAMNALYRDVDFGAILAEREIHYANAVAQVRAGLPESGFLPAMEAFYQARFDNYLLVPSLMIPPGMGFGSRYHQHRDTYAVHVFGAFAPAQWTDPTRPDMGFGDKKHLRELSTHEFGHSFVNPVIDKLPGDAIAGTATLFEPIREAMSNQAYTSWKACLYEHFVRAGEVIIAANLGHQADARQLRKYYIEGRKFIYLDILLDELEKYNRKQTASYEMAVAYAMRRLQTQADQARGDRKE